MVKRVHGAQQIENHCIRYLLTLDGVCFYDSGNLIHCIVCFSLIYKKKNLFFMFREVSVSNQFTGCSMERMIYEFRIS